ncbi:MAG: BNR-4 repeat-containing protein, partial [Akkermansiaceae bacterium]|nr:BNR-4 repeat-containing protein [Akkermansiaceae bacterium]
ALQFINISGAIQATGSTQSLAAPIPASGPDAFVAGGWFHVAATYNGSANTPDNFKLYWTRLDPGRTRANLILTSSMLADLGGTTLSFGAGNDYRTSGTGNTSNLEGAIDEVRISRIARPAEAFLFIAPDTDHDGLADPWEILHFRERPSESDPEILAKYDGLADPDGDTFDNETEETAGTDPMDPTHTPLDVDRDGYQDAWELATFGTTAFGPGDDPDRDGFTTAEELTAGTDPADPRSNPDDTDADGLPDAVEIPLFGDLLQGPDDDYDQDGATNQAELSAGTNPTDPREYPLVSFIPVTDANPATDENGYAGSAINSIAFAQNNLITVGNQQFIAYYRRHATDAAHPDNNRVLVARRTPDSGLWEIFPTNFTSFNINDTHNVISMAIDGDGILHMSWGMHGNALLYARSDAPVTGPAPIRMVSLGTAGMTGQENGVTYPKFQTLPDGDVVFLFREGGSGSGDWFLHRYNTATDRWAPVHADGSGVSQPLLLGRGDIPDNCFYPDRLTLGPDGMLHLAGVFRYNSDSPAKESGYQTNHRYVYLRSPDGGTTWQRSDGSTIDLPVVEAAWFKDLGASHVPEIIEDIPEGHSNMNESGMTTDSAGRPIIANWWAANALDGDHTRQYHIFFHDGTTWHRRTVSARDIDDPATKFSESQLGNSRMGRPVVLTDAQDRIIVVYNDNRFDGITVVFSLPLAQDPGRNHWSRMNLTSENIGAWESTYDEARWQRDGVLQMLYQKLPGMGAAYGDQNNSTPVSVVEWNARAYFNSPVRWSFDTTSVPGQATFSARTQVGFRYDLKSSTGLDFTGAPAATVRGDGQWHDFGNWPLNELQRFWRLERVEEATGDL